MSPGSGDDFEHWLERELQQVVAASRGPSPWAEQAAYRVAPRPRVPLAVRSARATAAVIVVAVAALGGVTGVAAMTGGPSPATFTGRFFQAMTTCREQATASQPGADVSGPDMGRCVITIASQREATPARTPGAPSGDNTRSSPAAPSAKPGGQAVQPSPSPPGQDGNAQGENAQGDRGAGAQGDNGNAQGDSAKRVDPTPGDKPDKPSKDKHPQPTPS